MLFAAGPAGSSPAYAGSDDGQAPSRLHISDGVQIPGDGQGSDGQTAQPDEFSLSPAHPNPFNPRTSFSLRVEERQHVTLDVFNLLGVHVQRLFEGVLDAGEMRTFTFVAEDLPSGIYLYRVQGETFAATRQMTLLK